MDDDVDVEDMLDEAEELLGDEGLLAAVSRPKRQCNKNNRYAAESTKRDDSLFS